MLQTNAEVLQQLEQMLTASENQFEALNNLDESKLSQKSDEKSWSALEAIEHLNNYNRFYLPAIQTSLKQAKPANNQSSIYNPGWLGNYFAKSIFPKENGKSKMKSPAAYNPAGKSLDKKAVLNEFSIGLQQWKNILQQAATIDLRKNKIPISITQFIKLQLGDILRVNIYHIARHIQQAEKATNLSSN